MYDKTRRTGAYRPWEQFALILTASLAELEGRLTCLIVMASSFVPVLK